MGNPDEKPVCVARFSRPWGDIPTGAQAYEHMAIEALEAVVRHQPALTDPLRPKLLRYKKLRYLWQNWTNLPSGDILITDPNHFFCGLNIRRFRHRILLVFHVDPRDAPIRFIQSRLESHMLRRLGEFDRVVVIAEYWKDFLARHIPAERIRVIPCAYDVEGILDRSGAKTRKELGLPEDKIVVHAGQACETKGFRIALDNLPPDRFHVLTTGRRDCETVHDHREAADKDYYDLLRASDVAVSFPRFNEGWTRVAHEALLCGTPVVGFDRGGLGELIRGGGQIIYPSPGDALRCVEEALERRDELRESGLKFARQFTPERFREQWRSLIAEFLPG